MAALPEAIRIMTTEGSLLIQCRKVPNGLFATQLISNSAPKIGSKIASEIAQNQ